MVFLASITPIDYDVGKTVNDWFAPCFEQAILEAWNDKYGGQYRSKDATIDISVNFTSATIELSQLEIGKVDALEYLYHFQGNKAGNRSDIVSYLWPGIDDNTFRYVHPEVC